MGALTDVKIRAWIKAGKPIAGKSDGDGLTFTLSESGIASWVLRYRIGGKQKELTLGRYPDLGVKAARDLAAQNRVGVQQGIDPALEKQRRKDDGKQASTVKELADQYLKEQVRGKHKHPDVTERVIRKDILPAIGRMAPKQVTSRNITNLLQKIKDSGRPTIANDALRIIKAIFKPAETHGVIDRNPASALDLKDAGGKETARNRNLSRAEVTRLFKAMRGAGASFTRENELAVKLLLVLAVRKMELLGARWDEFEETPHGWLWRIPSARAKTEQSIEIPLPPDAVEWLKELTVRACGSEYVFPARRLSRRFPHVSPDTLNVALSNLEHGLEPFTVHDLRRTARTLLASLGVPVHVAEKCLNHKLTGVLAVYDHHDYMNERREALNKLAGLIVELEAASHTDKVVQLGKRVA
ncbi:MAG: integrase arm-type DNA-binding domain-containing protein [Thiobacillaceae bacterium]